MSEHGETVVMNASCLKKNKWEKLRDEEEEPCTELARVSDISCLLENVFYCMWFKKNDDMAIWKAVCE